jgi:hypothetical protein
MVGLISILFFVFLCALFYSIGLPFRQMLKGFNWDKSIIVPSSCGLALASLTVTLGYKFALSPQLMFWLLIGFGLFCLGNAFVGRRRQIAPVTRTRKIYTLIGVLAAGLMLAPLLTGGINFALFQGNYIDASTYLQSAISYTRLPYDQIRGATPNQLLDAGLFPGAATNLNIRPTVAILYAVLSNFAPSLFLGLNYVMLVYFQFLSLGVLWLIARQLVAERPLRTLLLCVFVVGGFWGQYILDINAWSQDAALPLLLTVVLMLLRSFSRERVTASLSFWSPTAIALVVTGAFYLYPEATMFYLPGIAVALVTGFWKTKKAIKIGALIPAAIAAIALLVPVKENNIDFLHGQASQSLSEVDWWKYFDICFFGRGGISSMLGADLIDAGTTVLGGYMITPDLHVPGALALAWRGMLAGILVLVITNFLRGFRQLASPDREMLCGAVAVFILQTAILMLLHQYWTAGKALSYFAFLLLLVVFCPLLAGDSRGGSLRIWSGAACAVLLAAQGFMLIYRPIAAKKRPFDHYPAPYPAALDRYLKKRFDFSNWKVLNEIRAQDEVRIEVADPMPQYFAKMLLLSHNRKFYVASPVYFGTTLPLVAAPSARDSAAFTCRLYLKEVHKPALRQYLNLERLPPS